MKSRFIPLVILCIFCVYLFKYSNYSLFNYLGIITCGIFGLLISCLLLMIILGISNPKNLFKIFKNSNSKYFIIIFIFLFVGSSFLVLKKFLNLSDSEINNNPIESKAVVKRYFERNIKIKRGSNNRSYNIEVAFFADGKSFVVSHSVDRLQELPLVGDTILIYHSKINPQIFQTDFELNASNKSKKLMDRIKLKNPSLLE